MKTFFNPQGKACGQLNDGVYRKVVKKSKHLMRILDAFGIEKRIVEEIKKDCKEIRIKDSDSGDIYSTTMNDLIKNGISKNFDTPQVFLPLKFWHIESAVQQKLL